MSYIVLGGLAENLTTIYNIVSVEKMLSAFQTTELDMTFGIQFIS